MIHSTNKVKVYEYNNTKTDAVHIHLTSHRTSDKLVTIELYDEKYTVSAADLQAAIKNATNVAVYG